MVVQRSFTFTCSNYPLPGMHCFMTTYAMVFPLHSVVGLRVRVYGIRSINSHTSCLNIQDLQTVYPWEVDMVH